MLTSTCKASRTIFQRGATKESTCLHVLCLLKRMSTSFPSEWKQIVAATLIRAQAAAARSVIVSASTGAVAVGLGADVED